VSYTEVALLCPIALLSQKPDYVPDPLYQDWKPSITVKEVLIGVASLLHEPNDKDPANGQANNMFKSNKSGYSKAIREQAKKFRDV